MSAQWINAQAKEASFEGHDDVANRLYELEKAYSQKLWHQITVQLESFIQLPNWKEGDFLIKLYQNFLSTFQEKLNQLKLAQIAIVISKQFQDTDTAIEFLNNLILSVQNHPQAKILLQCAVGSLRLQRKEMKVVKELLEETKELLDSLTGVESTVNSSFYILSANFHKLSENAEAYYNDMLMYLSHIQADSLPQEEQARIAYDLSIAALVGESVYNFTELLVHPIVKSLENTPHAWLVALVQAFNIGDIAAHTKLITENRAAFNQLDIFVRRESFLEEKIRVLALMCAVFRLSSDERVLTFAQVAAISSLQEDMVEFLLIKSLSLKLIRGVIDQVDQTVSISWVAPRVLEMSQLDTMKNKLAEWQVKVQQMQDFMFNESPELITN